MAIRSLCPLCRREFLTLEMEHDANKCVDCMKEENERKTRTHEAHVALLQCCQQKPLGPVA